MSHHVSEDNGSETIDVHVLQQSIWVFDGGKVTWDILYDSLWQRGKENHVLYCRRRTDTSCLITYTIAFVSVFLMCIRCVFIDSLESVCVWMHFASLHIVVFLCLCRCITLLADAAVCKFSWVLLIGSEVLLPLSLCLCLHSRQFLTATQHTEKRKTVLLEPMP